MIESLVAAFQIPELRNRIRFVLIMFAIFVLGAHIPVPGVDHKALEAYFQNSNGILGLVDVFSGGALKRMSLFALGIAPYINASIIMQMMTLAIPQLEQMQKEGDGGRKRIAKITRHLTIGIAFVSAIGITLGFKASIPGLQWYNFLHMWITFTAGTCFLLWMGEQISEKGIGNGISMIIFAGIMTSLPYQTSLVGRALKDGIVSPFQIVLLIAIFIATVVGVVYVTQGVRRIPIAHAKRVVGMRMTQGGNNFVPIKVNTAGVIPIIFAISMMMFPSQIANVVSSRSPFWTSVKTFAGNLIPGNSWWGSLIYVLLIIIFTYFYTAVILNVQDMADNLKRQNNYIPGIRPGKPTFEYLDRVIGRITLAGAVFLAAIALVQYIAPKLTNVTQFSLVGGTSLLIVVGVAIETMQQIEAQLMMRNYEGFLK